MYKLWYKGFFAGFGRQKISCLIFLKTISLQSLLSKGCAEMKG
jgi:hypothetical protein